MNVISAEPLEFVLPLPKTVDPALASDIEKESVFVSPHLERILVNPDGASVRIILNDPAHADEVRDKAARYLDVMAKQVSGFDVKVFVRTERRDTGPYLADANVHLVEAGWLHDYGQGQVAYCGPMLKLARLIDELAGDLYREAFATIDGHYPAFIDAETLRQCGYFDSHPNAVTFVGNMVEDFDAIEAFRQANASSEGALLPPPEHIHMDGMCLNPAACFPCYPTLRGKRLTAGECHSWMGRVFRYESRNISGLDRLYEFNVRELVFVGDEDYTKVCREKSLKIVEQLARHFDLDTTVQTATDPFFATVSAAKKFWQQAQDVKNEVLIPVAKRDGSQKLLACGSINLHSNFFGRRFDITGSDGEPVHTGCVGLGIERWVLSCFSQHGIDPGRWPTEVRKRIF